jgi:hypothetical protein
MLSLTFGLTLTLFGLQFIDQPVVAAAVRVEPQRETALITVTVVLTPTKDNTLYESATGDVSNGAGAFFFVGQTAGAETRRGLLAFGVADQVPAGATVVSAALQLQMSKTSGGAADVSLHRALADWGESSSDATANEGKGATAAVGDATWLHTFHDSALWQTPGGDFAPTATATTAVSGIGLYRWPSSPAMVAAVQQWLDDPAADFGWVLVGDESSGGTAKRFTARESADAAARPQLTVVYTITGTVVSNIYLPLVQK